MITKLRITITIGFILLFTFLVLMKLHGISEVFGVKLFKLGNNTIFINNAKNTRLITDSDSINKYLNINDEIAFILVDDSTKTPSNIVIADYLQMGEIKEYDELLEVIKLDSTVLLLHSKNINNELYVKQLIDSDELGSTLYLLSRFNSCYPYYLRVRSFWYGGEETPTKIQKMMNSIEVRK